MTADIASRLRSAYAWALLSLIMLPLFPVASVWRWLTSRSDPRGDRLRVPNDPTLSGAVFYLQAFFLDGGQGGCIIRSTNGMELRFQ